MTQFTPGIDVSIYQGNINWPAVAAAGIKYAVIRASVGDYYTDANYRRNFDGARAAGIPVVSAYHVTRPNRPFAAQMARLWAALGSDRPTAPLTIDAEVADGMSPSHITNYQKDTAITIESETGKKPVFYTAPWFWDPNVIRNVWAREYPLHQARYASTPLPLPLDWSSWLLWQYSSSGRINGIPERVDLNWFAGSEADLVAWAGGEVYEPPTVISSLSMEVAVGTLIVRAGPGRGYAELRRVHAGDPIFVQDVVPATLGGYPCVWGKIQTGPDAWCCLTVGSERYTVPAYED